MVSILLKVKKVTVVPLRKATTASCGAKAAACAELATLAEQSKKKGSFGTAEGVCLPFGCMEAVIKVAPALQQNRVSKFETRSMAHQHSSAEGSVCQSSRVPNAIMTCDIHTASEVAFMLQLGATPRCGLQLT